MEFLYFLEGLRTPWLDSLVSAVTHMGGEMVFLVVALVTFWCVDKRQGYYLLSVGFMGTLVNQFLKITCRIPRPWVRDPHFTIVESARAEATGYSFPSGHSTNSVGTFGVIATEGKGLWVRVCAISLCVLIPLSRLYLGVHTPADVLVGSAIALFFIVALRPVIYAHEGRAFPWLLGIMVLTAVGFVSYVELFPFPANVDPANLESARENSYTLLGALAGMIFVWLIDRKTDFHTRAVWYVQIVKAVLGLALTVGLMEGLKIPQHAIFGDLLLGRAVRYMLVVIFAGALWPMTFPWLAKLERKADVA